MTMTGSLDDTTVETAIETPNGAPTDGTSPDGISPDDEGEPPATFTLNREVVIKSLPQSTTAESIHALRTHVVARHIQEGLRGIALCETEQAGGSFLAVNLAMSLAEAGVRTLLIDTRLRDPELANFIEPSRTPLGLADAIEQADLPIGSAVQSVLPDLSLMYAGAARDNALDLLGGARFATIIDTCLREFDFTIATTAPANRFADGRRVASVLRNAIVVARKNVTFTADVNTLVTELIGDQVDVIGTVFNDF